MHEGSWTPWGHADSVTEVAPGVWWVETPSHGGAKLDARANARIPAYARNPGGWYEEDCEWAIPAVFGVLPPGIHERAQYLEDAERCLKQYEPRIWERWTGRELAPGESWLKDRALMGDAYAARRYRDAVNVRGEARS